MEDKLKELQQQLASGLITQEQYNQAVSNMSSPFESDFMTDWMNIPQNNGGTTLPTRGLETLDGSGGVPINLNSGQPQNGLTTLQQLITNGLSIGLPQQNDKGLWTLQKTEQNRPPNSGQPQNGLELPSNYLESDYDTDNIPDHLQESSNKKREDFETDQEYYDYLKSRGVSDVDISELGLKINQPTNVMSEFNKFIPFLNPYGSNIEMELRKFGQNLALKEGTPGRGLGIASSAVAAGLGGARTLLSGLAQQKQTEITADEIRRQMAQRNYTPQTKYLNQNSRGGTTT